MSRSFTPDQLSIRPGRRPMPAQITIGRGLTAGGPYERLQTRIAEQKLFAEVKALGREATLHALEEAVSRTEAEYLGHQATEREVELVGADA